MGAYLLLSAVALTVLVFAVTRQVEQNRRSVVGEESRQVLKRVAAVFEDTDVQGDPLNLVRRLLSPQQKLLLLSNAGQVLRATGSVELSPLTASLLRSLQQSVARGRVSAEFSDTDPNLLVAATRLDKDRRLALVWDVGQRLRSASADEDALMSAVLVAWVCCAACVIVIAVRLTNKMARLARLIHLDNLSAEDRNQLMEFAERDDEFGHAAYRFIRASDHHQHQLELGRQREQEIRSSAVQLSAMLQAMVEGVIAVDSEERVLFANNVVCKMLQVRPDSVKGRPVFELIRNTHFQDVVHESVTQQQLNEIQFRMPRDEMYISLSVSPIAAGGAVLVFDDITEVRRLESMRRDFVSGVSHELKTPLTVIQACTETLLDGAASDPETARRFLTQISEQSDRLSGLIVRMLHLARVESGELVLSVEPVDVAAISRQIARDMQPVAESRQLELNVTGPDELYVLADDQAVRTVLGNLVDNAMKYTPAGGRVRVSLTASDTAASVTVSDTGIGISEKDQERVFERFYRVERDRNREQGGTGLGLAIVKHLCQGMKTPVSLKSSPGEGTSITITFPFQNG